MREFEGRTSEGVELPFLPELESKLDAIVVLGKNIGVDWTKDTIRKQRFHLSPHARISVDAAGLLYKAGFAERIIFSTGKTADSDIPSEAALMKLHLQRIFKTIPFASDYVLGAKAPRFLESYRSSPLVQQEIEKEAKAYRIQNAPVAGPILSAAVSMVTKVTRASSR
ncbi:MAG TPA: hypothetical protein VFA93_02085 [Patescibacteria group bacterium]|nr:hypothetical protein [Patescibacteria group bacterium]